MDDQLSGGPQEDRQSRTTAVIIAAMVLVLVVALVHQLSSAGGPTAAPSPSPTLSLSPRTLPPDPLPTPPTEVYSPAAPTSDVQPMLVGVPLRGAPPARLVLGGPRLTGLGAPPARVPVPEGEGIGQLLSVRGGLIIQVSQNVLRQLKPGPYNKVYLVRPDGAFRLLGEADSVVAANDGRSVFLEVDGPTPGANRVLRVDLTGKVLARHLVRGGLYLRADTREGLLVENSPVDGTTDSVDSIDLLDRSTFAVLKKLAPSGYVLGAGADKAAWTDGPCDTPCSMVIEDLRTGARHKVAAPTHASVGIATFSPDGRRVAVAFYGQHSESADGGSPGFVEVIDIASGHRTRVPGVATDVKQSADLAWTPDGRWLAIAVVITDMEVRRVGLWPAAGGPVRILPSTVPGTQSGGSLLAL
jgi:hypothetical protein